MKVKNLSFILLYIIIIFIFFKFQFQNCIKRNAKLEQSQNNTVFEQILSNKVYFLLYGYKVKYQLKKDYDYEVKKS